MKTGLALRIKDGKLEQLPDSPVGDIQWLQEQVGGYFEAAMSSGYGGQSRIVVWCNEDGHRLGLPLTAIRHWDGAPLLGTLIVTGCNPDGSNRGLTKAEASRVILLDSPMFSAPSLNFLKARNSPRT